MVFDKIREILKDVESKKEDLLKDNLRKFDKRYKASADDIVKEITNYEKTKKTLEDIKIELPNVPDI